MLLFKLYRAKYRGLKVVAFCSRSRQVPGRRLSSADAICCKILFTTIDDYQTMSSYGSAERNFRRAGSAIVSQVEKH
jgi:hypothetical protein